MEIRYRIREAKNGKIKKEFQCWKEMDDYMRKKHLEGQVTEEGTWIYENIKRITGEESGYIYDGKRYVDIEIIEDESGNLLIMADNDNPCTKLPVMLINKDNNKGKITGWKQAVTNGKEHEKQIYENSGKKHLKLNRVWNQKFYGGYYGEGLYLMLE